MIAAFAVLATPVAVASEARESRDAAPLSGVVRVAGRPVAGATLVVRGFFGGVELLVATLKSESDGTFVLPEARPGLYTLLSLSPGFRPAVARVLHRAERGVVSFVPLELERAGGVLPPTALGSRDPWVARAVVRGDVLRQADGIIALLDGAGEPPALPDGPRTNASTRASMLPVRASVSSMAGFASDGPAVSTTQLDVSGGVGDRFRFGVEGQYSRSISEDGMKVGDSSHLSVDVLPGGDQSFRVSTRRKVLPRDEDPSDPSRYQAHSLDWSGATGATSQASVSARMTSQSNLLARGLASDLFTRASRAFEVQAKYKSEMLEGSSIGFIVGYRAASGLEIGTDDDRETRVGGTASIRAFPFLVIEAGATGDFSNHARGVTPEVTVAVESGGWRAYGAAARRYERRTEEQFQFGVVSTEQEDVNRRSRGSIRTGIVYRSPEGESLTVEFARREIVGTYRYLLEPDFDFIDRLDSLYFFTGDVATEISSGVTFRIGAGVDGRVSARGGQIQGEREAAISRDDASYAMTELSVRVAPTNTVLGVGYRTVSQTLLRGTADLRNDFSAVDLSLAQVLPVPVLRGSEWKALFSMEFGRRREGLDVERSNRQFAGGLALGFN